MSSRCLLGLTRYLLPAAIFALGLSACDKKKDAESAKPVEQTAAHDHEAMAAGDMIDHSQMKHEEMEMAEPLPGASIYHLPGTWQTSQGRSIELSALRGQPAVIAIIYTSCEQVCPLIVEHIKRVEDKLDAESRDKARFVLVSMDPERDTVDALSAYAEKRKLDRGRWTLLRGDAGQVRGLAATLGVRYRQLPTGDFSHSNTITLLDENGEIITQRKRLDEPLDPLVEALRERL